MRSRAKRLLLPMALCAAASAPANGEDGTLGARSQASAQVSVWIPPKFAFVEGGGGQVGLVATNAPKFRFTTIVDGAPGLEARPELSVPRGCGRDDSTHAECRPAPIVLLVVPE